MFLLPSLVGIVIFLFLPFGETIRRSFTNLTLGTLAANERYAKSVLLVLDQCQHSIKLAIFHRKRAVLFCRMDLIEAYGTGRERSHTVMRGALFSRASKA